MSAQCKVCRQYLPITAGYPHGGTDYQDGGTHWTCSLARLRALLDSERAAHKATMEDLGNAYRVARESCMEERALGNGGCGCCTLCNEESRSRALAAESLLASAVEVVREVKTAIRRMDPLQEMVTDDSPLMRRVAAVLGAGRGTGKP